jgi:SAM-dependent methyltransferase
MRKIREISKRLLGHNAAQAAPLSLVDSYVASGQKPWVEGYWQYRNQHIEGILADGALMELFRESQQLPGNFGFRLDERVIEYPWVLSRLSNIPSTLLDAGSTLNLPGILNQPKLSVKNIIIYTLAPESEHFSRTNVSYIYGDLRESVLRDDLLNEIVCISTLEHIGLDNKQIYTSNSQYSENKPDDYLQAIAEFRRMLKPGGHLFITVPYGKYENFGWLQQFDHSLLERTIDAFGGQVINKVFYKYHPEGWALSDANECRDCEYFDIHRDPNYAQDFAAAARAVVCVELVK